MKAWFRVDADIFAHPKFAGISPAAFTAWTRGLAHCRQFRTDGTIAERVARTIATKRVRADLVERKLWHDRDDGGVDVHEYGEYQRTETQWQSWSDAGKKAAAARWDAKRNADRIENASDSDAEAMPTDTDTDSDKKTSSGAERRDEVWDTLSRIFGPVVVGTNPHGRRNKVASELRKMGATADTLEAACQKYKSQWPETVLTDTALAKHYPQLVAELKPKGRPPCEECEIGGGHHLPTCSHVQVVVNPDEMPTNGRADIVKLLQLEADEEAA